MLGFIVTVFLAPDQKSSAIPTALKSLNLKPDDILCIVRGGGNPFHKSFQPFQSLEAAKYLKTLSNDGIIVITGIGHSSEEFTIEYAVTYKTITPTAAAHKVNELITTNE